MAVTQQIDHIGRLYKLQQLISDLGYEYVDKGTSLLKDQACLRNKLKYLNAAYRALLCYKVPHKPAYSYGSFRIKINNLPATSISVTIYVDGVQIGTTNTNLANLYKDIVVAVNSSTSSPDYTAKFDGVDKIFITASVTGEEANGKKITVLAVSTSDITVFENTAFNFGNNDYQDDYNCLTQQQVDNIWDYIEILGNITLPPYGANWNIPNVNPHPLTFFLLREDGSYELREDGSRIILE